MAISVVMPALEMAQETGKLVSWKKKEGEQVKKGEMLLEVETDKAVVEIEAGGDGVLSGVTAKVGDVVPVGQTIAWLLKPGEAVPTGGAQSQSGRKMESAPAAATAAAAPAAPPAATARPTSPPAAAPSGPADAVSSIGRIMAERTTQSWTTVPHFFVARDVDATALNATREGLIPVIEKSHGVKITHTDLMVSAVARALKTFPRMNGSWVGSAVSLNAEVNVALAMAVDNAVVTAVIRNADKLPLGAIAKQRKELSERAKANKLQPADISGATFTISNLGMFGVDAFTAIIVPPQAGILAVGAIADRVVAVDGMIGIRPMVTLTLSSDHRIIDGARAAQFMQEVVGTLSDPGKWLA